MAPPPDAPLAFHAHDQEIAGAAPFSGFCKKTKAAGDEDHAQAPTATRRRISTLGQVKEEDQGKLALPSAPKNNHGGTAAQPIVVIDDDEEDEDDLVVHQQAPIPGLLPCPESEPEQQPAVMPLPACGKKKEYPWFCFSTWDPTDGGRYELLSTYLPPPFLNADVEDARRSAAAVAKSPLYTSSAADAFWGTPDGVWTAY